MPIRALKLLNQGSVVTVLKEIGSFAISMKMIGGVENLRRVDMEGASKIGRNFGITGFLKIIVFMFSVDFKEACRLEKEITSDIQRRAWYRSWWCQHRMVLLVDAKILQRRLR